MSVRAFTGPSDLTFDQTRWVAQRILAYEECLRDADVWRSGCAYGVDTLAAQIAALLGQNLDLYIPAAKHNNELVRELTGHAKKIKCPRKDTASLTYRARNEMLLAGSDFLLAFVWKGIFYRSGEWMTINIARRTGVPHTLEVIPEIP